MNRGLSIPHSRPTISTDDLSAAEQTLRSEMITTGKKVNAFEEALCRYIGGAQAIATCSGKTALVLALFILDVRPGDEVIVPTYVCKSVMDAILYVGAQPIFADIEDDYCISPDDIERKITTRTKAIVAVHIFGISANMRAILDIGKKFHIRVIEDCAQSIGGEIDARRHGSFSDVSFFSFHATKVMTTGEGGMVVVNAPDLLDAFKSVKQKVGSFFAMTDLQAAVGICQLSRLPEFIGKRRSLAKEYMIKLAGMRNIELPICDMNKSMFFRFPIRARLDFYHLRSDLEQKGVQVRKGVDSMLHQHRAGGHFPTADRLFRETISLPIYPMLEILDVDYIVSHFKTVVCNGHER